MTRLSPRSEALAYRIWAFCKDQEWNCTASEIAEALDTNYRRVSVIARAKGWLRRLPSRKPTERFSHVNPSGASSFATDHILDGGSYAQALRAAGVPERGARLE